MMKEKSAVVLYANYLDNKIGPSTNLRRLLEQQDTFKKYHIAFDVFSFGYRNNQGTNGRSSNESWLKNSMETIGKNFLPFSFLIIYLKYLRHSIRLVDLWKKTNRDSDCYIFEDIFTCYFFIKKVKPKNTKKLILFHHGSGEFFNMLAIYYPPLKHRIGLSWLLKIRNSVFRNINDIIFVSNFAKGNFRKIYDKVIGDFKFDTHVLYYGIPGDIDNQSLVEKRAQVYRDQQVISLVCVGTVNDRKAQHLIVEAFEMLDETIKKRYHVKIIGGGPNMETLKNRVFSSGDDKYIHFVGPSDKVNDYLLEAHGFILTSLDEGLPIALIEALKYGLFAIGTNVAGIPEAITDKFNGLLISPKVDEIAGALKRLLTLDLAQLGMNSRNVFLDKFAADINTAAYCKIINED